MQIKAAFKDNGDAYDEVNVTEWKTDILIECPIQEDQSECWVLKDLTGTATGSDSARSREFCLLRAN